MTHVSEPPKGGQPRTTQGGVRLSPRRPREQTRSAPYRNVPTLAGTRNGVFQASHLPRILLLDIETAPLQSYHWGLWDQNIGLEQIGTEWSILSFAAKWLGVRKMIQHDTGGRGVAKVRDDRKLLGEIWKLLDEADIVVAQGGKGFDIPKINARLLMAGFGPYSPIRHVDTLLAARRHFKFTSNKLAWLTKHLTPGLPKLDNGGFKLWIDCLADKPGAWRKMRRYNVRDVVALEPVYLKLRPWIESHPNVAVYDPSEDPQCPKCGSKDLTRNGSSCTQVGQYARYRCKSCRGFSRGRLLLNSRGKRASLLSN